MFAWKIGGDPLRHALILDLVAALRASAVPIVYFALCTMCSAAELPVSATYGTPQTCDLYARGGGGAVFSEGGSIGETIDDGGDTASYMLVSPSEIVGLEWGCHPINDDLQSLRLTCSDEGDGSEWTTSANIILDKQAGTLIYQEDAKAPVYLQACSSSEEPGLM